MAEVATSPLSTRAPPPTAWGSADSRLGAGAPPVLSLLLAEIKSLCLRAGVAWLQEGFLEEGR